MTTNDIRDQLVLLVCDELDETERTSLKAAMQDDPALTAEAEQLAQAMRAITPSSSIRVREDFNRRLRERLQKQAPTQARGAGHRRFRRPVLLKMGLAAAAAILLAVGLQAWFGRKGDPRQPRPQAWFSLLSEACAAENAAFVTNGMVHIRNEIVVHPVTTEGAAGGAPAGDSSAPGYTWIPICSLQADGQLAFHQLRLAVTGQSLTVEDSAWYDSASGRFARVLKTGDVVIFANSFDGSSVYAFQPGPDGALKLTQAAAAKSFRPPKEPAAFLGISAGLRSSLNKKEAMVQEVSDGKLTDGAPARVYKVGIPGPQGTMEAYWLFKVRLSDGTVAEKDFCVRDRTQLSIRRVLTERVQQPAISWTLAELKDRKAAAQGGAAAAVHTGMVIPDISVAQMVQRADFETYTLAKKPSWTEEGSIADVLDVASPPKRMFVHAWRAGDGRHVVMVQSPTYNKFFGQKVAREGKPTYESPAGCKLYGCGDKEKWLAGILLSSARVVIKDPPGEKRMGGLVLTPAGTIIALAVNGQLSDAEWHGLIDDLVPAKGQK